ncbi:hypothetical protein TNCT_539021 [Trichonephila clavata]|uniref:Uncharacterized protein n=1 Tax=Trichonephila clavata TaxID=2740835 RepID=A0A8X6KS52_TRICU|nr:hypothetical protein TNCT_539021 [Trichonephila clavata]
MKRSNLQQLTPADLDAFRKVSRNRESVVVMVPNLDPVLPLPNVGWNPGATVNDRDIEVLMYINSSEVLGFMEAWRVKGFPM